MCPQIDVQIVDYLSFESSKDKCWTRRSHPSYRICIRKSSTLRFWTSSILSYHIRWCTVCNKQSVLEYIELSNGIHMMSLFELFPIIFSRELIERVEVGVWKLSFWFKSKSGKISKGGHWNGNIERGTLKKENQKRLKNLKLAKVLGSSWKFDWKSFENFEIFFTDGGGEKVAILL